MFCHLNRERVHTTVLFLYGYKVTKLLQDYFGELCLDLWNGDRLKRDRAQGLVGDNGMSGTRAALESEERA